MEDPRASSPHARTEIVRRIERHSRGSTPSGSRRRSRWTASIAPTASTSKVSPHLKGKSRSIRRFKWIGGELLRDDGQSRASRGGRSRGTTCTTMAERGRRDRELRHRVLELSRRSRRQAHPPITRRKRGATIVGVVGNIHDNGVAEGADRPPCSGRCFKTTSGRTASRRAGRWRTRSERHGVGTSRSPRRVPSETVWSVNANLPDRERWRTLRGDPATRRWHGRRSRSSCSPSRLLVALALGVVGIYGGHLLRGLATNSRDRRPHGPRRDERSDVAKLVLVLRRIGAHRGRSRSWPRRRIRAHPADVRSSCSA